MRARVMVRRKSGVKDPQGDAVLQALENLGFEGVSGVRIGKVIDVELAANDAEAAKAKLTQMADALLANPVMESFTVEIDDEGGR